LPVVISHFTWTSVFGSAPDILGREIRLNGYPATIVAVAPEFLDGTKWGVSAELWVPIEAWARHAGWSEWEDDQGLRMTVLARMRRGVDVAAVNAALASLASGMAGAEPAAYAGTRLEATDRLRGDMGPEIGYTSDIIALIAILGGVLVLLVGCGNVASLQLARGVLRARDVAIRHALGASRNRIVRQLLTENLILVLLATVAGVALAALGTEFLVGLLPTFEFRVNFVTRPGTRSLLLAAGLTIVTVVASGLVPALQLSRTDLVSPMKSLGRGGLSRGRARLLGAVVVGMVGASVLALFLAGVFGRALSRNRTVDPGFATSDRIMAVVPLRLAGYGWRDATVLFEELEDRLSELPGVVSVGYGTGIPLGEAWSTAEVLSADREYATGEPGVRAFRSSVSDDYFRAMGTRIIAGRAFRAQDGPQGPWVAMVNEELADRLWPGEDPIGRRIRFGRGEDADPVEVIGLVETGVYYMAGESPEPAVFASFRQWPEAQAMVMLESRGDPLALIPGFRDALAQVDPDVPLQRIRTAESHFDQALWLHRLGSSIGWTVAVFSLLLAAAGLLGVMSFTLGARRHEMGVRRVLGAQSLSVVGVAVRGALRLTVLGLAVGAVLSVVAGQLLRVALTGVEPLDPLLIGGIMLFILFTGTLSGLLPGLSASRVDPVSVLNAEN
jgi:predicted permease